MFCLSVDHPDYQGLTCFAHYIYRGSSVMIYCWEEHSLRVVFFRNYSSRKWLLYVLEICPKTFFSGMKVRNFEERSWSNGFKIISDHDICTSYKCTIRPSTCGLQSSFLNTDASTSVPATFFIENDEFEVDAPYIRSPQPHC